MYADEEVQRNGWVDAIQRHMHHISNQTQASRQMPSQPVSHHMSLTPKEERSYEFRSSPIEVAGFDTPSTATNMSIRSQLPLSPPPPNYTPPQQSQNQNFSFSMNSSMHTSMYDSSPAESLNTSKRTGEKTAHSFTDTPMLLSPPQSPHTGLHVDVNRSNNQGDADSFSPTVDQKLAMARKNAKLNAKVRI